MNKTTPLIFKIYQSDKTTAKTNFNKWIEETIHKYLPAAHAKDKNGEVFTPEVLIEELMNNLKKFSKTKT